MTLDGLEAGGGTATGDALQTALGNATLIDSQEAPSAGRDRAAVRRQDDRRQRPDRGGARGARLKIPIYTVALGTPDGVVPGGSGGYIPVPPDPETLREIARVSHGQAFTAEDSDELDGIYEKLGRQVGTKPEQREVTAASPAAGFVLLLAAVGTGVWWRSRRSSAADLAALPASSVARVQKHADAALRPRSDNGSALGSGRCGSLTSVPRCDGPVKSRRACAPTGWPGAGAEDVEAWGCGRRPILRSTVDR